MRSITQLVILLTLLLPIAYTAKAAEVIPMNEGVPGVLLSRIFQISTESPTESKRGTCFVIEVDEGHYLVTARHIVPTPSAASTVKIFYQDAWHPVSSKPIFPENKNIDAVALALPSDTLADLKLEKLAMPVGAADVILGQKIFFLGFPFGFASRSKDRKDLIPFVKAGILSGIDNRSWGFPVVYIDGHNNHGFSGGPVVFANLSKGRQLQILGVISGYWPQQTDVMDASIPELAAPKGKGTKTPKSKAKKRQYIEENSGITIAYQLNELVEAIRKQ